MPCGRWARTAGTEAIRIERRQVERWPLTTQRCRERLAADRAEADARAFVARGDPQPGHRRRRAERGQAVGEPRPQARPRVLRLELGDAGDDPRRALEERLGHRGVDRGVEAAALPARAHHHLALPRGLQHRGELEVGLRGCDGGEVGAVEDLVAHGRGAPPEAHELALARLEREREASPARELGAPRAGGEDDGVGAKGLRRRCGRARRARGHAHALARQDGLDARMRADPRARRARLEREPAGNPARIALEVVGEVRGAEEVGREAGLERARLLGLEQLAPGAGRAEPRKPRGLGGEAGRLAVDDERALAPDTGQLAVAALDLLEGATPQHGEVQLRARVLVRAEHVALAEAGGAARDLARIEQVDLDAAPRERVGGGRADDPGADDGDPHAYRPCPATLYSEKPAGKGSVGSSRYWPMPVIHARPVTSGITAGRPATSVSSTRRPVKRVPITDSCTNGWSSASSPRACSCAIRADVPVPHGERSSQPGWIETAARASAPSRPGAVKITCRTPAMRSSAGCTGGSEASIAAITRAPASISSGARAGSTSRPADAASTIA